MIVSASRRTDIPALYVRWLERRLAAGYCTVPNPFNVRQVARVSLRPEDVDAIVFWTRWPRPLFRLLPALDGAGFRYYFQFTVLGYGSPLEPLVPPLARTIRCFRELADRRPKGSVVWRYDPILLGPAFPGAEHRARFARIAKALESATERVVVSLMTPYHKTRRRIGESFRWSEDLHENPQEEPEAAELLRALVEIAGARGMRVESCASERDWSGLGVSATKCVDDRLLGALFGGPWESRKDPGQRPACGCIPSKDIGIPDTCVLGCLYCYATRSASLAERRFREHDPESPSLWGSFAPCEV